MIFSILLLALLAVVLFGSFAWKSAVRGYASGSSGKSVRHKREYLEEVTIEDNGSPNKVLVIDVSGVISSADMDRREKNMVESIAEQLQVAADDSNIRAVILKVNSPGGEVLASDEIYRSIQDFQADTGKPVIASMQTLAASGGYYVSAPCRWIVANELTITGSIGVIMHGFNYRGLMNKVGLKPMIFK
ncbi:MAG: signal peptide peptidase SppA, type, partial [Verrucomicrobiales bacterium]|nr:signal peptide peptidase SppA, type [Verrucomicrobiales bacterium]